jgi:hypothetical protein
MKGMINKSTQSAKKNIFVVGLDDFNLSQLQTLRHARDYDFHSLISYAEIKTRGEFPVRQFLHQSRETLEAFSGTIDAIVGYWDFPVSTILPIVRRRYHLPGPSLEAVLKCEHKYWSRQLQADVVPDCIPAFAAVNPFSTTVIDDCELEFPFWLKPVKAASSHLGFHVHNRREFEKSLNIIRQRIGRFAKPFNYILEQANLPPGITAIDGFHCIAEGIISAGKQCTLEGYVHRGAVHVYGIVDSIREGKHHSCFARYEYPSSLPEHITSRMIEVIEKVLTHMGYDDSPFNAEFYWDKKNDNIWLLEINARISKSHCPLFKLVDGEYHHAVMIDVALGNKPHFPHRQGPHKVAAKFMLRHYRDGVVTKVPSSQDMKQVQQRFPDCDIQVHIHSGMRLGDLKDQDSYSYEIAVLFMGADNRQELLENYHTALEMLPFEIDHDEERD